MLEYIVFLNLLNSVQKCRSRTCARRFSRSVTYKIKLSAIIGTEKKFLQPYLTGYAPLFVCLRKENFSHLKAILYYFTRAYELDEPESLGKT